VYPVALIRAIRGNGFYLGFEFDATNTLKMYLIDISSTHIVFFLTKEQPTLE
jgi:acetylornithine/succinyldiaminopimelate/putrescine aminotransferase